MSQPFREKNSIVFKGNRSAYQSDGPVSVCEQLHRCKRRHDTSDAGGEDGSRLDLAGDFSMPFSVVSWRTTVPGTKQSRNSVFSA